MLVKGRGHQNSMEKGMTEVNGRIIAGGGEKRKKRKRRRELRSGDFCRISAVSETASSGEKPSGGSLLCLV